MWIRRLNLNEDEKRAFTLHALYSTIEGVILGVIALNEFVFLKSLGGSNYLMSILFTFSMFVYTFLIPFNEFLKRVTNRRRFLRKIGIYTRLPLLLLLLFPRSEAAMTGSGYFHYIFLAIFLIYYLGNPIIHPTINFFLKSNYRHQNFGKLYSYSISLNKVILLVTTFLYGLLLDFDNYAYVYVFPMVAVLGVISVFLLSMIKYPKEIPEPAKKFGRSVRDSIKNMWVILKENKPYRHFEIAFMLYGFAFMTTYTVINIFFYEQLNLNYTSVAFYRNSYNILAIVLLPFMGPLLGKIDPRKFGVITFSSLILYIFFLMLTEYFPWHFEMYNIQVYYLLIFYIVFHGVFAATMVLLWNIGSAYFGPAQQAGTYQSIHLSLTGLRSIFSPLAGVFLYELYGFTVTFIVAMSSILIGIGVLIWSYHHEKRVEEEVIV
ncbi:MAG: MFS transporter [Bacteroidales bacterium]|nr:MFS transporter [Bacteroidales bacterium]MCF8350943.1 MFS transporter [Bacteroidales bacterium]MCF8376558.1 MFS transporter [Bacteroidales bacterium]MCF8400590.1 MFS transporter [Bacteroidales bacterium]